MESNTDLTLGANLLPTPEQAGNERTYPDPREQELLIAADIAAMRLEAYRALHGNAEHKSIGLFTPVPSQSGYHRHRAAIERLIAEAEAQGWSVWFTGRSVETSPYMVFERKRAG
jgi:hypothetical protein